MPNLMEKIMFYAMAFYKNEFGKYNVRAVRTRPFKKADAAIKAVKKVGQGYVKQLGEKQPIWSN